MCGLYRATLQQSCIGSDPFCLITFEVEPSHALLRKDFRAGFMSRLHVAIPLSTLRLGSALPISSVDGKKLHRSETTLRSYAWLHPIVQRMEWEMKSDIAQHGSRCIEIDYTTTQWPSRVNLTIRDFNPALMSSPPLNRPLYQLTTKDEPPLAPVSLSRSYH